MKEKKGKKPEETGQPTKCSVLQCVAVCCSVLQWPPLQNVSCPPLYILQCIAVCCSVLQYVAVCCSVLHCMCRVLHYTFCSALQCVAVCCSMLQCVAVCCSGLHYMCRVLHSLVCLQVVALLLSLLRSSFIPVRASFLGLT